MKKEFFIFILFLTGSLYSAKTFVINKTKYLVKAKITYVTNLCDDEEFTLAGNGDYKEFNKGCCLKHVQFTGLDGPIKGVKSSALPGEQTGARMSCKNNRFKAVSSGNSLIIERLKY